MMRLKTDIAESLYLSSLGRMREFLQTVDLDPISPKAGRLSDIREAISAYQSSYSDGPDSLFDDLYAIERYVDFLEKYAEFWLKLASKQFSSSWVALQDALDLLRLIRRFSEIDISQFESQLTEIEKTYPYNVFFSIGASVDFFECSICGEDIDSFACKHRRGNLYRGKMAYGIVRGFSDFDHISIVDKPEDKRCVVSYKDDGPQFELVRYIAHLITSRTMCVSQFGNLAFSKRRIPNQRYKNLSRNAPCYCGSGRKFKRCCINEKYAEGDHVDVVPRPFTADQAII